MSWERPVQSIDEIRCHLADEFARDTSNGRPIPRYWDKRVAEFGPAVCDEALALAHRRPSDRCPGCPKCQPAPRRSRGASTPYDGPRPSGQLSLF